MGKEKGLNKNQQFLFVVNNSQAAEVLNCQFVYIENLLEDSVNAILMW